MVRPHLEIRNWLSCIVTSSNPWWTNFGAQLGVRLRHANSEVLQEDRQLDLAHPDYHDPSIDDIYWWSNISIYTIEERMLSVWVNVYTHPTQRCRDMLGPDAYENAVQFDVCTLPSQSWFDANIDAGPCWEMTGDTLESESVLIIEMAWTYVFQLQCEVHSMPNQPWLDIPFAPDPHDAYTAHIDAKDEYVQDLPETTAHWGWAAPHQCRIYVGLANCRFPPYGQ